MRCLVTGGAGFLGSHLCDRLIALGYEVIAVDNLLTGTTKNIAHLTGEERFCFIKQDVTEYLFIEGPLDWIFHFASPASPIDYQELPIQTLKVGSLGTHKALGLAKEKKARFLIASTSEVYGDPLEHPQSENYWGHVNPIGPRGVYDEAKRFAEALTMAYHRYHGLDTRILRIFNTFGPRMRVGDGRVVPTFIAQALRGEDLTIFGSGEQTRSFCYVEDMMDGITALMERGDASPVNIGNPEEMSVLGLARLIQEILPGDYGIRREPLPEDDPKVRQPNIERAKSLLGWEPKYTVREGLIKTIEWYKEQREKEAASV